ncbi:MAG: acetyl-CoA carboxylase carboxyltransferase subunit alpha/beta, partial [Dehalococcoidia bacterium]
MVKTFRDLLRRGPEGEELPAEPAAPERCLSCAADLSSSRSFERYRVCHSCGFHFHLTARERVATLLDPGTFHEDDRGVTSIDPISFADRHGYRSRVINAQRRTGLAEAVLTGTGLIYGKDVVIAVLDFSFMGGSIGVVAGERLARAFEKAAARRSPILTVCSTSGTRMQEGLLALMQLPRIAVAAQALERERVPHIALLTDPTTGSAYAGFVNQADFILAEPGALVGFAAMRVVQEAATAELPKGAHTAEAQVAHGLIDAVIDRTKLRDSVASLIDLLQSEYRLRASRRTRVGSQAHEHEDAWRQVQLSRHSLRPTAMDLIAHMATAFVQIHGDRVGADDPAIVAGVASLGGEAVMLVGQQRHQGGAAADGWVTPSGFRKAERAMRLAAKFDLP